jgi:hypothetical protein
LVGVILLTSCREEDISEGPSLGEGEFILDLFNEQGDLLLTKKGTAENLFTNSERWEIRLLDPQFIEPEHDPLSTFAFLVFIGQNAIDQRTELSLNHDNIASFRQRWYSLTDDWGYQSTSGSMRIEELGELRLVGSFEITLEVAAGALVNTRWGNRIVLKGRFSSTCPYQSTGGC